MQIGDRDRVDIMAFLFGKALKLEPGLYREVLKSACLDPSTGAFNTRFFHVALGDELNRAQMMGYEVAIAEARVRQKRQAKGERLIEMTLLALQNLHGILQNELRRTDWAVVDPERKRFLIVLPGCNEARVSGVLKRIKKAAAADVEKDGNPVGYSLKLKVVGIVRPEEDEKRKDLLEEFANLA